MIEVKQSELHVMALGLRGIPNIPGGVEVHASELYPRLRALGVKVTVLGRRPYRTADCPDQWRGVDVRWISSPKRQGAEALIHTFLGVLYAAVRRPDVLHIHAVGPWLCAPLAKMLGLKVVVTHHGQDYLREKWNKPARVMLQLGERFGIVCADKSIVISHSIREVVREKYGRDAVLIPNGVSDLQRVTGRVLVDRYGLTPQRYIVQVSRLVPEKRQLDLIAAFKAAALPGWKLVLVGGAQGSQRYAELVAKQLAGNDAIVCTGFLSMPEVQELLSHAGIFVLPSSHEGLPIALLEAMKIGIPVVASNIAANLEIGLDEASYFPLGDIQVLASHLRELAAATDSERETIAKRLQLACARYDWDVIAKLTMQILEGVGGKKINVVPLSMPEPVRPQLN
jgi:glycosyltransferase involved in cell wall biosynthesis